MHRLNHQTLAAQAATEPLHTPPAAPVRFLQFGEGNFLRAFVDYFIDVANERCGFNAKVTIVQPIEKGLAHVLNEQEGLYTLYLRGAENGRPLQEKRLISCVQDAINPYADFAAFLRCAENPDLRFIASNTTEAGIAFDPACALDDQPPASFPAKLTRFLYERWRLGLPGLVILSCELIDNNGAELKRCTDQYCALWGLEEAFTDWLKAENTFCSTLVDRIVTGYPAAEAERLNAENGYEDRLLDAGERFALWVIEGPAWLEDELPFKAAGLPVLVTSDHAPYKRRKVRILNGAHTALVSPALLCGLETVGQTMADPLLRAYTERVLYKEVIPTLDLDRADLESFAAAVFDRFANPYIQHNWTSIALNTTSKWKARVLPSVLAFQAQHGQLPPLLTFSFAAALELCAQNRPDISDTDRLDDLWTQLRAEIPGFEAAVTAARAEIQKDGCRAALARRVEAA